MSSGNDNNEFPPGESSAPMSADAGGESGLNTGRPAVASAPGKLIFVILFIGIFIFVIARSLFFSKPEEAKEEVRHPKGQVVRDNSKGGDITISSTHELPTPPVDIAAQAPPPPVLPPPPPTIVSQPNPDIHVGGPTNEALNKRIHSTMFVMSGNGAATRPNAANKRKSAIAAGNDPNGAFADSVADSKAQEAKATLIEKLDSTIVQGKIVTAVLETAINSSLPGPIRAIVSHDTYAEAGKDILIPKGSRLIGVYNSQVKRGQARVFIIWHRLVRPDGIDIEIQSPGSDPLGRAGEGGDVDNKYFEMFSTAILTSSFDVGIAAVGDALFGNQQTTTTTGAGGTTTTQSPTSTAMQTAVTNIGNVGKDIVDSTLNLQPVITIDQGSVINVFVNRDLVFPRELTGTGGFVP